MVYFWLMAVIILCSAISATIISNQRVSIFAVWLCGMGIGGMYLTFGAEYLAFFQWMASTLLAVIFLFYSVLYSDEEKTHRFWSTYLIPFGLGIIFFAALRTGLRNVGQDISFDETSGSLAELGLALSNEYLLVCEILGIALFIAVVGIGVISRREKE